MSRLAGKVALVTGGAAGIGAATARVFRAEGAQVFVVDSSGTPGADLVADVADERSAADAVEASLEQAVLSVNLLGAAHYCRAALPALRKSGRGSIVMVSSVYGVAGRPGMGLYDATKAALLAMTRTLAHEEAKHGIRVNAVCPGSTLTDFHIDKAKAAGKDIEKLKRERDDTSLVGRWAAPEEIAWPILWLASDEASFITGTALMADGGLSIK